ncbi:MAG: serine/threonine protein phosphatase [bacterium]|nr:serine/threonine protein phosphatase [bacterium]
MIGLRRGWVWAFVGMVALTIGGCAHFERASASGGDTFTIAMIPDTQNYVDFTHQKAEGFAIDAADLYLQQMQWVADNAQSQGGEIAFVASVGDTWQHPSIAIDSEHAARGIGRIDNPFFGKHFSPTDQVAAVEIPSAIAGYEKIAKVGLPFGVPPGNHDYDAMYNVDTHPPNLSKPPAELRMIPEDLGLLHVGGLDNFRSAFGDDSAFFADKSWYVAAFKGGTSSAQIFEAGGYRFLHLALEMQAADDVLSWARGVMDEYPELPTIVSTHDYLSPKGTRIAGTILDFTLVDAANHNTPQQMFEKLIAPSDQIFLVLCGHYHGQANINEKNEAGNVVHTILADYQDRGQVGIDAGQPLGGLAGDPVGLGDGWLRLLEFDTASDPPSISVRTYSTYYGETSGEHEGYVAKYRDHEQPDMSDEAFLSAEEFEIVLEDFRARFGAPAS